VWNDGVPLAHAKQSYRKRVFFECHFSVCPFYWETGSGKWKRKKSWVFIGIFRN